MKRAHDAAEARDAGSADNHGPRAGTADAAAVRASARWGRRTPESRVRLRKRAAPSRSYIIDQDATVLGKMSGCRTPLRAARDAANACTHRRWSATRRRSSGGRRLHMARLAAARALRGGFELPPTMGCGQLRLRATVAANAAAGVPRQLPRPERRLALWRPSHHQRRTRDVSARGSSPPRPSSTLAASQ
jgi:hypothetical protein